MRIETLNQACAIAATTQDEVAWGDTVRGIGTGGGFSDVLHGGAGRTPCPRAAPRSRASSNAVNPDVPGYSAGTGWDPTTGLGTPNAAELIPDLAAAAN